MNDDATGDAGKRGLRTRLGSGQTARGRASPRLSKSPFLSREYTRLTEELVAVYTFYERYGATALLAAMARAEKAGAYSADALAVLLAMPPLAPTAMPTLFLPGVPTQADVDRRLSVYEAWV